jgi:predicted MPP superfamily phosphohydrolase
MRISRRAALKSMLAASVAAATGGGVYGFLYGRYGLGVTRATVGVRGLPSALEGIRIGLLTDVHCSRWVSQQQIADAAAALMNTRPDLIVLGGDYVTWGDRHYVDRSAEALSALSAAEGVFAILGNHDDDTDMPAALRRRGVHVLKDARTRLTIRNEALELVGIRFWTRRAADIATLTRGAHGPVILLAHDPRRIREAAALDIPLVLSGHTHGGQVVLPVVGAVAARKFPVVAGLARRGNTSIFVSRGVGTVYVPVRVNCPPEVALVTLVPAAAS